MLAGPMVAHVDLSVRETVPAALDRIGYEDVATILRQLKPLKTHAQLREAAMVLQATVPELCVVAEGIQIVTEVEKDAEMLADAQAYGRGVQEAQWAILAALDLAVHLLSPNAPTNLS